MSIAWTSCSLLQFKSRIIDQDFRKSMPFLPVTRSFTIVLIQSEDAVGWYRITYLGNGFTRGTRV